MNVWTIFGRVLVDTVNENGFINVQASNPPLDGQNGQLSGTTVQVFVDVPPPGVLTTPEASLAFQFLAPHQGQIVTLAGIAPGGGIFLIAPQGGN
jgi:hypothetical protein